MDESQVKKRRSLSQGQKETRSEGSTRTTRIGKEGDRDGGGEVK